MTGGTFTGDADVLAASTAGTSITASYNASTETLTLSGTDTLAHYQQVLDSVTFNAGENPTNYGSNPTRTVTWTLNDGSALSTPLTETINITKVDDPPILSNVYLDRLDRHVEQDLLPDRPTTWPAALSASWRTARRARPQLTSRTIAAVRSASSRM